MAVVCNLKQLQAAVLHQNFDGRRTGVDGVFDELLQRMHRSDDDLTCGNFVDDIGIQSLNIIAC